MSDTAPDRKSADVNAASERLSAVLTAMPSSTELCEAALVEILVEQLKVIQSQRDVGVLLESTDRQLTATVQVLRDENATLGKLIGQAREAFLGELAVRAADQARRSASEAVVEALERLRLAIEARERHAPVPVSSSSRAWLIAIGGGFGVACVMSIGLWLGMHFTSMSTLH
ncbi:hypothetical protein [Burkholderia territorii]|uniref:hypothetical protein n=1 Tax=Burkholderia territorii TaxID=1503055 RepID=UPI000ACC915F|nr:hypothetical protein [Burkholderia territorii]